MTNVDISPDTDVQASVDGSNAVVVIASPDVEVIQVLDPGPPGPPGPQGPPGHDGLSGAGSADAIMFVPSGNLQATNVQDALTELDTEKVQRAGDTMIGQLALPTGAGATHAVRKDYVDAADAALGTNKADKTYVDNQDALKVAKAGDVMTGHLTLPTGPAAANAVRKDYVDTATALNVLKAGDVMTGHLTLPAGPAAANAVRKDYVDAADALKGDKTYVDSQDALKINKAGDVMTGILDITMATPNLRLNKSASGQASYITGTMGAASRWQIALGDTTAESAGAGSNFAISRFSDAGAFLDSPLQIVRASGNVQYSAGFILGGAAPTSTPGNGNTTTGFELWFRGPGNGANLFSSINVDWNANWSRVTAGTVHTFVFNGASWVGNISITSTATSYATSSGAELKEDLKSFDAGGIIDETNVYDFAWKSTKERAFGVIAQQANEVYPQAVTHHVDDERDWWGVDYSKYVPVLLQELKALRARVAQLEAKASSLGTIR